MHDVIHRIFHHRTFWHRAKISELSEIYLSYMLRTMAISVVGIFIPIYLYELGYSIFSISLFFMILFLTRILIDPLIARAMLDFGPKNVLKTSYPLMVINLGMLVMLESIAIPLPLIGAMQALAIGTFFIPFNLEYSFLKHSEKEGDELGTLLILRKFAAALGPLLGGFVATWFGVESTIYLAMVVTLISALPLFINPDYAKTSSLQNVGLEDYARFSIHLPAMFGYGLALAGATLVWPLFLGIIVFQNNVYATLGVLVTASFFVSVFSAKFFGKVLDNDKGKQLLEYSAIANAGLFFIKPFISNVSGAFAHNFADAPIGNALGMTEQKGFYDLADSQGKRRISALIVLSAYVHLARVFVFAAIAVLAVFFGQGSAMQISFVISGFGSLLFLTQKFSVYR